MIGRQPTARSSIMAAALLLVCASAAHAEGASTPTLTGNPTNTPAPGAGARLVEPADGAHLDYLSTAPTVQFDPGIDVAGKQEAPKWVLIATDPQMTSTIRYCRYFVWAVSGVGATSTGSFHWGCNRWATGTDALGNDQLQPLEVGKAYYWQVVSASNTAGAADVTSAVRSFYIAADEQESIADISNRVTGSAIDDGSSLNLGAAAFVNSGVRVKSIASTRLATWAFRIRATHVGTVDYTRSYVVVRSRLGQHVLKVARAEDGSVSTVWKLTRAERALRTKRFSYQLFVRSTQNGAMVRSQQRVLVIKTKPRAPAWTPDR